MRPLAGRRTRIAERHQLQLLREGGDDFRRFDPAQPHGHLIFIDMHVPEAERLQLRDRPIRARASASVAASRWPTSVVSPSTMSYASVSVSAASRSAATLGSTGAGTGGRSAARTRGRAGRWSRRGRAGRGRRASYSVNPLVVFIVCPRVPERSGAGTQAGQHRRSANTAWRLAFARAPANRYMASKSPNPFQPSGAVGTWPSSIPTS